ncbi:hypothetical protein NEOLI_004589 [Neolecta irregularis DAH-3]|uniref:Uncharacterized protein n=1 Tax=Neolecta irregularis (strain DAH-3) TaxID=1198029 RepID=A0A1U7LJE5_NEOID|nr:hypothetical protein NEOLI_004589 [Neolecta irregularis DAH-3]|eukprot:OLL22775.1 hypothetical protein NEOLI_004589 [Neolecta irregularis DAH-3]
MIYWEAQMLASEDPRGISFNKMLILLSHWKIVDDNKSLALDEFLKRRARLQRVEELVSTDIISGFFQMMYSSRLYQANHSSRVKTQSAEVPQIVLHDPSSGPPTRPRLDLSGISSSEVIENLVPSPRVSGELSVHPSPSRWNRLGRSTSRRSSILGERLSPISPDGLTAIQFSENDRDSADRILDSFEESPWADALQRRSRSQSPTTTEMAHRNSYRSSESDGPLSPRLP